MEKSRNRQYKGTLMMLGEIKLIKEENVRRYM